MTTFAIVITVLAVACFGAFVLLGAQAIKLDGRRQKVLNHGQHPVTTPAGHVTSEEAQHHDR